MTMDSIVFPHCIVTKLQKQDIACNGDILSLFLFYIEWMNVVSMVQTFANENINMYYLKLTYSLYSVSLYNNTLLKAVNFNDPLIHLRIQLYTFWKRNIYSFFYITVHI